MKNRLQLDFSIRTNVDRSAFLNEYLTRPEFTKNPPTPDELDTMAKYILWGEDPETGLNGRQSKSFDLETKHGTWDSQTCDSLDVLMEAPTFNEASVSEIGTQVPLRKPKEVFDREKELARAGEMKDALIDLWSRIDQTDYQIEFYEIEHGRRQLQIREELINRLTDSGANFEKLEEETRHWGQPLYLKHKHLLVELRREQYTLRDIYAPTVTPIVSENGIAPYIGPDFGAGIQILPLGLKQLTHPAARLVFRAFRDIGPYFSEEELRLISKRYWEGQNYVPGAGDRFIDFRNAFHIHQLIGELIDLERAVQPDDSSNNTQALIDTFNYYRTEADLDPMLGELLDMKIQGKKNQDIAAALNAKYQKSYTVNYISTLFCQKIVEKICDAAKTHVLLIENTWFFENWKVCTGCGRTLLRDPLYFTRKSRAADGLNSRCKACEKKARQAKS